jgi:hypothetical protein
LGEAVGDSAGEGDAAFSAGEGDAAGDSLGVGDCACTTQRVASPTTDMRNLALIRFSFAPLGLLFGLRVRNRRRTQRAKVLRRFQMRLATLSLEKSHLVVKHNPRKRESPIQFQKRSQPFFGAHNETLSVVAMHNELNQFGLSKRPTIRHNSRHDSAFIGLLPSKRAD